MQLTVLDIGRLFLVKTDARDAELRHRMLEAVRSGAEPRTVFMEYRHRLFMYPVTPQIARVMEDRKYIDVHEFSSTTAACILKALWAFRFPSLDAATRTRGQSNDESI